MEIYGQFIYIGWKWMEGAVERVIVRSKIAQFKWGTFTPRGGKCWMLLEWWNIRLLAYRLNLHLSSPLSNLSAYYHLSSSLCPFEHPFAGLTFHFLYILLFIPPFLFSFPVLPNSHLLFHSWMFLPFCLLSPFHPYRFLYVCSSPFFTFLLYFTAHLNALNCD